jgi:broad specificity phosphatase PhoE
MSAGFFGAGRTRWRQNRVHDDMPIICFETHATSVDNEAGLASGHYDADLSHLGVTQATELGRRYDQGDLQLVLTSDLRRAWRTAEIAFDGRVRIHRDPRLRECDYGVLTRSAAAVVESMRQSAVDRPFTGGESYRACTDRVRLCLADHITATSSGILVIGHRATFYALEHLINAIPLETVVGTAWRWQPGWRYEVTPEAARRILPS